MGSQTSCCSSKKSEKYEGDGEIASQVMDEADGEVASRAIGESLESHLVKIGHLQTATSVGEAVKPSRAKLAETTAQISSKSSLLHKYTMEEKLGEGSYGVVYACSCRSTGKELAVKMVDRVESPIETIMEEVRMLEQLSHPNICRFVDVVYEKCFVCIVMNRYAGGSFVICMLQHWKNKGKLSCSSSAPIVRQMASPIAYLHSKMIVHRDVKGDNFLTTVEDVTDPTNLIVLSDFGTAIVVEPGERLRDRCGTRQYWAPEFYAKSYSLKVDVWAVGVLVFAMLLGNFPFKGEADVKSSVLNLPSSLTHVAKQYIQGALMKHEAKRFTGQQLADHPFVCGGSLGTPSRETKGEQIECRPAENMLERDADAHHDVTQRRNELVERLVKHHEGFDSESKITRRRSWELLKRSSLIRFSFVGQSDIWSQTFQLQCASSDTYVFEWWSATKAQKELVMRLDDAKPLQDELAGMEIVTKMLAEHGIGTASFGKGTARPLEQLAQEVHTGVSRLMLDATQHKKLVRVIDVMLIRIIFRDHQDVQRYLIELSERYPDGRTREAIRLPGTRKLPHESSREAALRLVQTLNIEKSMLDFDWATEVFEQSAESPSYPGVTTVYRKEIVEARLMPTNDEASERLGLESLNRFQIDNNEGGAKFYTWLSEQQCLERLVEVFPHGCNEISSLVRAPIGLKEEELRTFLLGANVNVEEFGREGTCTLKEFSQDLIKGEASIVQDKDGNALRVVDIIVLRIINSETGDILVQTKQLHKDGSEDVRNRLPFHSRRPDENQFLAARRFLMEELHVDDHSIHIDASNVSLLESYARSTHYPQLLTIYRERIINVTISKLNVC